MPSSKFSKPPVNEARPLGTPRPVIVKRQVPPKKPALVVEPVTFEQAVDILASTHDVQPEPHLMAALDTLLKPLKNNPSPDAFSACNDNPLDVVSTSAKAITPRFSRIRTMEAPATIVITASAWTEPKVFTLDTKARKGVTSVVYTSDEVRGSARLSKSVFAEPRAAKAPRVKMTKEEATAARNAGRLAAKNLTATEKLARYNEREAKRRQKLEADAAKEHGQLVTA